MAYRTGKEAEQLSELPDGYWVCFEPWAWLVRVGESLQAE